jgi:hypothetical protein
VPRQLLIRNCDELICRAAISAGKQRFPACAAEDALARAPYRDEAAVCRAVAALQRAFFK